MKKRKIIQKLEEKGIVTVEELLDALDESVRVAGINIKKFKGDINELNGEIDFKQEKIEKYLLIQEQAVQTINILIGN